MQGGLLVAPNVRKLGVNGSDTRLTIPEPCIELNRLGCVMFATNSEAFPPRTRFSAKLKVGISKNFFNNRNAFGKDYGVDLQAIAGVALATLEESPDSKRQRKG